MLRQAKRNMTPNVPVQRAGRNNWMLALYSSPVRCNRLLGVIR